jgi:hypothetical protein
VTRDELDRYLGKQVTVHKVSGETVRGAFRRAHSELLDLLRQEGQGYEYDVVDLAAADELEGHRVLKPEWIASIELGLDRQRAGQRLLQFQILARKKELTVSGYMPATGMWIVADFTAGPVMLEPNPAAAEVPHDSQFRIWYTSWGRPAPAGRDRHERRRLRRVHGRRARGTNGAERLTRRSGDDTLDGLVVRQKGSDDGRSEVEAPRDHGDEQRDSDIRTALLGFLAVLLPVLRHISGSRGRMRTGLVCYNTVDRSFVPVPDETNQFLRPRSRIRAHLCVHAGNSRVAGALVVQQGDDDVFYRGHDRRGQRHVCRPHRETRNDDRRVQCGLAPWSRSVARLLGRRVLATMVPIGRTFVKARRQVV